MRANTGRDGAMGRVVLSVRPAQVINGLPCGPGAARAAAECRRRGASSPPAAAPGKRKWPAPPYRDRDHDHDHDHDLRDDDDDTKVRVHRHRPTLTLADLIPHLLLYR